MRQKAQTYFERIEQLRGMIPAIESGYFRREIAEAAFVYQREVDAKRKLIVGVNAFQEAEGNPIQTLMIDESVEEGQIAALRRIKSGRDAETVRRCLDGVRSVAAT